MDAKVEERKRARARARMATKADRLRRLKITETQQRNRKQKLLNRKQKLFRIDRANVIKQVSSVGRSRLRHVWPQWLCDTISREVLTPAQYKTNERRIACCTPTQPPRRKRPKRRPTSTPPCRGSTPHRRSERRSERQSERRSGQGEDETQKETMEKHSFKAWDRASLQLSPFRTHFKTVFTKKGGVHEDIVSMLEADLTTGMRGEQFANKIMELQTKEYHRQYIQREREFLRSREVGSGVDKGPRVAQLKEFFSDFDDPDGYDGRLRCAKFYKELFMDYSEACGEHCDKEVKKRGAERLHFDASYKVSKLLCRVFGLAGYKCLQTGLNEFGEIVVQVFTYSDAYDQMITPLHAMNETAKQYGQPGVRLFTSDKPRCDRNMSHAAFPGVKALQRVYDKGG